MSLAPDPETDPEPLVGVELCSECALAPEWEMCGPCRQRMAEFHGDLVETPQTLRHRPTTWERTFGGEGR